MRRSELQAELADARARYSAAKAVEKRTQDEIIADSICLWLDFFRAGGDRSAPLEEQTLAIDRMAGEAGRGLVAGTIDPDGPAAALWSSAEAMKRKCKDFLRMQHESRSAGIAVTQLRKKLREHGAQAWDT